MTTKLEILVAARALIADPVRWTKGHLARDANGEIRTPDEPDACSWCAYGALMRVAHDLGTDERSGRVLGRYLDNAARVIEPVTRERELGLRPIAFLNDVYGHEKVLRAYDLAIEGERAGAEFDRLKEIDA